jgi:hypothetical protein
MVFPVLVIVGFNGFYNEKVCVGRPYHDVLIIVFMALHFSGWAGMRLFEQWGWSWGLGFGIWCSMDEMGFVCIFFGGYVMISAGFIVYAAVNNLFFIIQTDFIN